MIRNIPKSEINNEFRKELRKEILLKIHTKKNKYYTLYFPILSGLSLCGVLIFVGINMLNSVLLNSNSLSFAPNIERADDEAFGNNIKTIPSGWSQEYVWNTRMPVMTMNKMAGDGMIANDPIKYTFSYTGKLDMPTGKLTVYKRNSVWFERADTRWFTKNLRIDELNIQAFENAGVSNINISEDREFGYNIGIDFIQGTINISQNYTKWPQAKCDANRCTTPEKLTEADIPTDELLIRLTNEFTQKYNIDTSLYGDPEVNSGWRIDYTKQQNEGNEVYIPEMYTVTYPIKIDNQLIYEEFDGYKWLIFTIDIRNNRVSNMTWLEKHNLIASKYQVSDESKIRKLIQSGGRSISDTSGSGKIMNITLTQPTIWYVRIYGEWKEGESNDFLVPAYIFKILDKPTDAYISDTIIVPLVEWFTDDTQQVMRPMIEPMMMK